MLNQIFFKGKKIKKAAKDLKINYSSAKTILHLYRKKFKSNNSIPVLTDENQCEYRDIEKVDSPANIQVVCTFGGQFSQNNAIVPRIQAESGQQTIALFIQGLCNMTSPLVAQKTRTVHPIIVTPIDKNIFN